MHRKWFLTIPIILAFMLTCGMSIAYGKSIGVDIIYHVDVARQYAIGNFSGVLELERIVNGGFYPPLLHLLLVPSVWLNAPFEFTAILQALFLPLAVASLGFLVYKTYGVEAGLFVEFLVLGSWAYIDRVMAVQPQSINFIMLPLAYYFLLNAKHNKLLATSIIGFYNHSIVSLAVFSGVLLKKIKQKKWLVAFIGAIAPLLIVTLYYMIQFESQLINQQLAVSQYFWTEPLEFWIKYVRLPIVGFGVAVYLVYCLLKKREVHALSKLSLLSLASSFILIIFMADRYAQYATIPLSLLVVDGYLRIKDKLVRAWLFVTVAGFMGLLYATLWFLTFNNGFQT